MFEVWAPIFLVGGMVGSTMLPDYLGTAVFVGCWIGLIAVLA